LPKFNVEFDQPFKEQTNATEQNYRSPNKWMIEEQEARITTANVYRRLGLSPASFYKFKAKYCGMNVSDTYRLKSLEDENAKLKRLFVDSMLANVVLKDLLGKNLRHRMYDGLQHARRCGISRYVGRACLLATIPRLSGVAAR
jgi:putative transposase